MYKLIHLHTDFKFLHDTLRYRSSKLDNVIVFIGEANEDITSKLKNFPFEYHIFATEQIYQILEKIDESDGVVLNDLEKIKVKILEKISSDKKVFLRLFGYELYGLKRDKFLSKKSLELVKPITLKKYSIQGYLKRRIKRELGLEFKVDLKSQKELYSKINAILLFNKFEYEDLSKYFYLPKFIQLSLETDISEMPTLTNKNNEIIIGNSRNPWNNHLDIFKELKKSKKIINYRLLIFFNYGPIGSYTQAVKENKNSTTHFIEDFLDKENFENVFKTASALVINSYRQHALGNVFTALTSGAKVYLNKKSSTYKWLKYEGFAVSNIDELAKNIDCNEVKLTLSEHEQNSNCFKKLKTNYTATNFIENIITVLKNE